MRLALVILVFVAVIELSSSALTVTTRLLDRNEYNLKWKYGAAQTVKWITIHNTANKASADNEASYLNTRRDNQYISFHYVVDNIHAIQLLPDNTHGWHAGDGSGEGNKASIGVEIAQSTNDNISIRDASIENGARLAARLLKRFNFGTDRLRKHQDWSGKVCPHDILGRYGWANFVSLVQQKMNSGDY
ncbi:unnamed protein product [Rotaria magnacalcarata]|uniref:N-acetylmuramoyl-L-alanine amidase n=2 Tax=Rotaria magnacalcarata TaxID=392030 RepID=A0A819ISG8_9BILA|nr:unnamed protein product [Rotaria magnacalcarata]CAF1652813.1 unnamed protein product [Rotaria magnacalcarata]CAF2077408.1 unnamed protein product [Rotaria magnacalcarata]CAF2142802.1 unnamed protein product [Rotaria magnacalcarata]CAF2237129.1 unnamed protein product [Rotaria magnacalcarata]